jgi:hypothetical protein
MKIAVLFAALLVTGGSVAGCSRISWFGEPEPVPQTPQAAYDTDEAAVAALDACKMQARAVIRRDARIDRDIGGGAMAGGTIGAVPGLNWRSGNEGDLIENMNEFEVRQRYDRIVDGCMRQRGYGTPAEKPTP